MHCAHITNTNTTASGTKQTQPAKGGTQTQAIRATASETARTNGASTHGTDRSAVTAACARHGERTAFNQGISSFVLRPSLDRV